MTNFTHINMIYLGTFDSTDVTETDFNAERADLLSGQRIEASGLQVVAVTTRDAGRDGAIADDDRAGTYDRFSYELNGQAVTATSDAAMRFIARVTLSDGTSMEVEALVVQATNGDVFVSDLLNGGTLDDLEISAIELITPTGTQFSGWFANQSVDGSTIVPLQTGDGIVEGSNASEVIDAGFLGDPEGDLIDADDQILPGAGTDDDSVDALGGDDIIRAGAGNDTLFAGSGNDLVEGGSGDDVLYGDSNLPSGARESLNWSDNADQIGAGFTQNTGSVEVSFETLGQDTGVVTAFEADAQNISDIDAGDEAVSANSSLYSVTNGDSNDASYAIRFSQAVQDVSFRINDIDGDGVVTIRAFDAEGAAIEVTLSAGNSILLSDEDSVPGEDTADSEGGYAPDTAEDYSLLVSIIGPVGRIELIHSQDGPNNSGINVTDVFFTAPNGADTGADGDDRLLGGAGDDVLFGEGGDDILIGGQGADTQSGGAGADTFIVASAADGNGDRIDGGSSGDDQDTLDLTGSGAFRIVNQVTDADGNSTSGTVEFLDASTSDVISTLDYTEIENIVPCFTPGTSIATPRGEMLVEDLQEGDKIITRDNGIQEIRWIGAKRMEGRTLQANPHLQPVLIQRGALGHGLPERDMLVSPNHRMLVNSDRVALYFEQNEVLVSAKHLVNPSEGIQNINSMGTTYIHFMFDSHEVVLSNGAWSESFQPGDYSLKGIGNAQRNEIFELFPELQGKKGREAYSAARLTLKKREARMLFR